jgi:hypothetical protein
MDRVDILELFWDILGISQSHRMVHNCLSSELLLLCEPMALTPLNSCSGPTFVIFLVIDSFHTINIGNVDTFSSSHRCAYKLDIVYLWCTIQLSTSPCLIEGCTRYHKFPATLSGDCTFIVLVNFLKP